MIDPFYDEEYLESDLVSQIWQYTLSLEYYIVNLREQINYHTEQKGLKIPFSDLASDFAIRFYDHAAFEKFADALKDEEPKYKIID